MASELLIEFIELHMCNLCNGLSSVGTWSVPNSCCIIVASDLTLIFILGTDYISFY